MGDPACWQHLLDDEGRMPDFLDLEEDQDGEEEETEAAPAAD